MEFDDNQRSLLSNLEYIFKKSSFFPSFFEKEKSLYVFGPVGRGKTTIIRSFLEARKVLKLCMHHEQFMLFVYDHLSTITMDQLIKKIHSKASLLWIDELQFRDMGETILLMKIIKALLRNKVSIILSGNPSPSHLFSNVHVHPEAQKALDFFQKTFRCIELNGETDYRNRSIDNQVERHFFFNDEFNIFQEQFNRRIFAQKIEPCELTFNQRHWMIKKACGTVAWLDFKDTFVCPRSSSDYQALTNHFDEFFLSIIPILNDEKREEIKRLIVFVDLIYEKGKKLFLCAEALPKNINQAQKHSLLPFERTLSRLTELCQVGDGLQPNDSDSK